MPNEEKNFGFSAYQVDVHSLQERGTNADDRYMVDWDAAFFYDLLSYINQINTHDKKQVVKDKWVMFLNDVFQDDDYIKGIFTSAEYGRVGDLLHVDTLDTRENPKEIREGERNFSHFIIRKSDGFMLLQTSDIRVSRSRVFNYINNMGEEYIRNSDYTKVSISSLVTDDLLRDLEQLSKVKETILEVSAEDKGDENEFISSLQNQTDNIFGTHVQLAFKAKWQRDGLSRVTGFVERFREVPGVTSIKVEGEDSSGAHRVFSSEEYAEKYRPSIRVDGNNNPISESLFDKIINIANERNPIIRH